MMEYNSPLPIIITLILMYQEMEDENISAGFCGGKGGMTHCAKICMSYTHMGFVSL